MKLSDRRQECVRAMAKYTVMAYQPLDLADDPDFREFCKTLDPEIQVIGKEAVKDAIKKKICRTCCRRKRSD